MKWLFLVGLILGTPILAMLLRGRPRMILLVCFLLGPGLYFLGQTLWVSPISWVAWPGYVRGIYVSFIDAISIALITATHRLRIPVSIKLAFAVYCCGLLLSTLTSHFYLMPAAFYAWQLFRTVLLFVAIARVCGTVPAAPIAIVSGLGLALGMESLLVVYQFASGVQRAGGSFSNANYMGLSLDYAVFPVIALMLGTRRLVWPGLAGLAAIAIAVLGGSRATLGLLAAGIALTVLLSLVHRRSGRKFAFAGATALLLLVSAPVMLWAVNRRSEAVLESSNQMRQALKLSARMIITDYPLGIGPNSFVVFANTRGYNDRAGVPWNGENRYVPVHNTYYLVGAEMGLVGLAGLVSILVALIALGLRTMRRQFPDDAGELVPGLLATMIIASIHIAYEFVVMDFVLHAFFAIAAGILVGLKSRAIVEAYSLQPRTIRPVGIVHAV